MLLKRQGKYRFEDFEVDLARRTIQRQGRSVTISSRSFDLLLILMRNDQRPVSKDELMHALWPGADVEESNLNQNIFLLRKALTGVVPGEKILASVPGRGFQFTSAITEVATEEFDPGERRFRAAIEPPTPQKNPETSDSVETTELIAAEQAEEQGEIEVPENAAEREESPKRLKRKRSIDEEDDTQTRGPFLGFLTGFRHPGLWHWAAIGGLVLVVLVVAILLRSSSQTKLGETPQALSLVIADFENSTGNADFDGSIKTALSVDLRQSPFVTIAPETTAPGAYVSTPKLSPDQARQLCSRLHDQAYLTGNLRRFAGKYFVTVKAFACSDDRKLAGTIGIAESPDAVISILDRVAVDLRKQLGEPADSVARFSKPLFAQRAASLEALRAYAEGSRSQQLGKMQESVTLLQRAVELDPQFAIAFGELGSAYSALGQKTLADAAMNSAYQLRETVGERNRLAIEANYHRLVTGDLLASIRNDKQWREEYPRDPLPLNDLAGIEINIGRPALALEAAQRSLELSSTDSDTYVVLARAQLHLGQIEEAAATCGKAIAQHADTIEIHGFLYQIGFLRLDQPAMDEQMAWAKSHGAGGAEESYMLTQQGLMNFAQGKVKAGVATFTHLAELYRSQNQEERANRLSGELPRVEAELGYVESALSLLLRLPDIHGSADIPVAWAETDETSRAQKLLQRELDTYPTATLWQEDLGPQIRGATLLNQHEPEKAIAALERAQQFDLRSFDVPAMTGRAYLAAKKPAQAEAAYRKIIDHPGIEPLSYNYPLAQLGLARSLAQQGKLVDATQVYKVVLAIWKDADPDLLRLRDAKAEYAKLSGASISFAVKAAPKASPKPAPKPVPARKPAASKH